MTHSKSLAQCVGYALTGKFFSELDQVEIADPFVLVRWLKERKWDSECLRQLKADCQKNKKCWPFTLPKNFQPPAGAAQFHAWINQAVDRLGLDSREAGVRDATQPIDARTKQLLADRPPHHGSVG